MARRFPGVAFHATGRSVSHCVVVSQEVSVDDDAALGPFPCLHHSQRLAVGASPPPAEGALPGVRLQPDGERGWGVPGVWRSGLRRRKKIMVFVVVVFGGVVLLQAVCTFTREGRLRWACEDADRVVVNLNTWPERAQAAGTVPILPTFELGGTDIVAGFFEAVDLRGDLRGSGLLGWRCMCFGNVLFQFYDGDRLLATVSYHHGKSLEWRDGWWSGHADLTGKSRAALDGWLKENGCPTYDQVEQIAHEAWEAKKAAEEKPDEGG